MRIMHRWALAAMLLTPAWAAPGLSAQDAGEWDVTETRGELREIDFTTDEGTWLSVDVSPDGSWMVFDLLGHVWRAPTDGSSEAVSLTQETGAAVNYHPRISPDGSTIAFISDQEGQDNLWLMDADGSDQRAVFTNANVRTALPAWTPDGEYVLVDRSYVGSGSGQGQGGIWMYHRDGGSGVQLLEEGTWPSVSPDGRHVYFQVREGSADALAGHYQVRRLDRETGVVVDISAGFADGPGSSRASSGGGFAPEISPDGRWLAFARQIPDGTVTWKGHEFGPRTALWLRDLETGAERVVMDPIGVAIESGSKSLRILPGYDWNADGSGIVVWEGGKIRRVEVATGEVETLPFSARVRRTLSGLAYGAFRIEDDAFRARFLRWHTASPDGSTVAFQAVGRVWLQDRDGGEARRLTPGMMGDIQEFAPAWSPDGRWIAFTTWDDVEGGHVWKAAVAGGAPLRLTEEPGEYVHPAWSADGRTLVLAEGAGATRRGRTITHNPWWDVVTVSAEGGPLTRVARVSLPAGQNVSSVARRGILAPTWGPDGRIFFPAIRSGGLREGGVVLTSVRPDGLDRREHLLLPAADEMAPSPDGRWVAFQEGDNVYLSPFPYTGTGGDALSLEKRDGELPVRQLTLEGGLFPRWRDATTVEFGSATRYMTYDALTQTGDTVDLELMVDKDVPRGSMAFTGARIVTLEGDQVVESGTVVVEGARIACVGECDTSGVDQVLDASGKTIIPGFIDMHSHHYREHRGYRPLRDYESAIYLAYGVTTSLDNSMWSQNIFPTAELIEAGRMIGPRTFSTGDPLYRGDGARQNELSSYEVAAQNVRRLKSWGATSIKQYMQPRRSQRQWVSDVARDEGLMVTAEAGDLFYNIGMIVDGQTAWEHPLSYIPIFGDVAKFFGRAGIVYSPTFVVAGPGPYNIEYWFAESDVWKDEKQRRWMPWRMNMGHLRRRMLRPDTDYSYPMIAQGLADIIAEGGRGAIGSHGEHHGPDAQWEVWMAAAGMSEMEALKVASLQGAWFLGAQEDLGSVRQGKLADLLVLDANPLEDIRNTADIRWVVKGGVVYEAATLDEVWPRQREFGPYYWVDDAALRDDARPVGGGR